MKPLIVLCAPDCGYCKKAKMLISRALETEPKYVALDIRYVMEDNDIGDKYAHTLVPAFYCGTEHCFEGNPHMSDVTAALNRCLCG